MLELKKEDKKEDFFLVPVEKTLEIQKKSMGFASFTKQFFFLKQLTGIDEAEALIGSRGVAVKLQPQAI